MFKTLENPKKEGPGYARANAPACILERFGKTLFCELINRTKGMDKDTLVKIKVAEMVRILEARAAAGALVPSPGDVVLHLRLGAARVPPHVPRDGPARTLRTRRCTRQRCRCLLRSNCFAPLLLFIINKFI